MGPFAVVVRMNLCIVLLGMVLYVRLRTHRRERLIWGYPDGREGSHRRR